MFLRKSDYVYKNNSINADKFDMRRFNELLKMSKGLQNMRTEGNSTYPLFDQLMGDVWSSFFITKPRLLKREQLHSETSANAEFMNKVMADPKFEDYRVTTQMDDLSSALATVAFSDRLMEWIRETAKENEQLKNALEQAMKALQKQQDMNNKNQQSKTSNQQDNQQKKEGNSDDQTKQQQQAQAKAQKDLQAKMEQLAQQIQQSMGQEQMSHIVGQAAKDGEKVKDGINSLIGGTKAGSADAELHKIPLRDQLNLADLLKSNEQFKRIAEWAGRLKQIAKSKQKSMHKDALARNGVTVGKDIGSLLPMEMANLAIPQTKLDFMRRLAEGQTMIYDPKGKTELGRGSIILCLDESGTMNSLKDQAIGFSVAMMSVAKRQHRDFCLIRFSGKSEKPLIFPKGKMKADQIIDVATHFLGGGTNFYDPLTQAMKHIHTSRFKNADIVFVTDGDANLSSEMYSKFNKFKKQKEFSMVSVMIGSSANSDTLKPISDKVIYASDFTKAGGAFEI